MPSDTSDAIGEALAAAPATPAGRQTAWYLDRLHRGGEGASLADDIEPYNMWTPGIAVPDGAETRCLHVDPTCF